MASIDVGIGLWSMRSTAPAPASWPVLYRELQTDARLAEDMGLHSLWLSEHHFWYDGWCPSLLVAGASVLGATSTLHVGTGVFLMPLHDPARLAAAGLALEQLGPGRCELGVGIGYREPELDGLGISRRHRGRRMDRALETVTAAWTEGGPRIWIGGIAERSLQRGIDRGLSFFLPSSMRLQQLRDVIGRAREAAAAAGVPLGRIGVLKNAWVTDGSSSERRRMTDLIGASVREYAGSWWLLQDRIGFAAPDLLERQMQRTFETALIGPPEVVAAGIRELNEIGVDLVVLHVSSELTRPAYRENMAAISADVLPLLS